MYTEFNEKLKLKHNTQYLCVIKGYQGRYYYAVLTWYTKAENISKYDFDGKGFYDYDSEYGYCKRSDVVAYQEIEDYIQ